MNQNQFMELVDSCATKLRKNNSSARGNRPKLIYRECASALASAGEPTDEDNVKSLRHRVCQELGKRSARARAKRDAEKLAAQLREVEQVLVEESVRQKLDEANEHICPVD